MSFHPHEQRAMSARPLPDFGDKKRSLRGGPQMNIHGQPKPQGFDPDDLCRRLYVVAADRKRKADKDRVMQAIKQEGKSAVHKVEAWFEDEPQRRKTTAGHSSARPKQNDNATRELTANGAEQSIRRSSTGPTDRRSALPSSGGVQGPKALDTRPNGMPNPYAKPPPKPRTRPLTGPRPMSPGPQRTAQDSDVRNSQHEDQSYRHVPQVAATQFERTTTADDRNMKHKLSQPAMNFHMAGPEQDLLRRNENGSPLESMHSLERVRSHRDREFDRNQFQHPPIFEELTAHDDQQFRLPTRQTFETHFGSKKKDSEVSGSSQRFSVGSAGRPRDSLDATAGFAVHHERTGDSMDEEAPQMKWRVDWTQSDEARPQTGSSNPIKLRKADSKWTLKGKLSGSKKAKENVPPQASEDADQNGVQSPTSSKSPTKTGFFGRFKR